MNYYEVLELNKDCSIEDIKKKFRRLSLKYHPDKNPGKEDLFKKIRDAYEILSDPEKKLKYDNENKFYENKMKSNDQSEDKKENINDIMKMFFNHYNSQNGISPFQNNSSEINKPDTINYSLDVSLQESFIGITKPIQIERWIFENGTRKIEQEQIYVEVPKGIDSNEFIILGGKGNKINEENVGDVKCIISLINDTNFIRKGLDLLYNINVSFKESLIGFERNIEYLNGKKLKYKQPRGKIITNDFKKVISNFGIERNNYKGNLILNFNIEYPEKINEKVIDFLEKNL